MTCSCLHAHVMVQSCFGQCSARVTVESQAWQWNCFSGHVGNGCVCVHRVSIVAKEGIPCLVRVLGSVEDLDTSAADALSSTLSALLPSCDSLGGMVRFLLNALIYASGSWSGLFVAWGVRAVSEAFISLALTSPEAKVQSGLNGVL